VYLFKATEDIQEGHKSNTAFRFEPDSLTCILWHYQKLLH